MSIARTLFLSLCAATLAAVPMDAQPGESSHSNQDCFFLDQFQSWRAPDPSTIYIRVAPERYFRLDLAGACSRLKSPQARLITNSRGKNTICSPLDWDLRVSQSNDGGEEQCVVRSMTKLDPAEVASIPKPFKP
jgi:hypothetical protein